MNNRRPLLVLCAAIFAAAIVAFPGGAYATGGEQTANSHAMIVGRDEKVAYYDSLRLAVNDAEAGETVKLISEDTIAYGNGVEADKSITIDLDHYKLYASQGDNTAPIKVTGTNTTVTVKNGAISSKSGSCVILNGYKASLTIDSVAISSDSTSTSVVEASQGSLNLVNGTSISGGSPALKVSSNTSGSATATVSSTTINGDVSNDGSLIFNDGKVTGNVNNTSKFSSKLTVTAGEFQGDVTGTAESYIISGGTFKGDVTNDNDNNITVTGGTFKDWSLWNNLANGYKMFYRCAEGETAACYEVSDKGHDDLENASGWRILLSESKDTAIYFEYGTGGDIVKSICTNLPSGAYDTYEQIFRATFKDGDEVIGYRSSGQVTRDALGELPTVKGTEAKDFAGWKDAEGNTPTKDTVVTTDTTYYAQWTEYAAKYGDTRYATLQGAIDAATQAGGEATVTLLNDVTETVTIGTGAKLTLDLNGKTLTNKGSGTIKVNGARDLTIKNGTVKSTNGDCLELEAGKSEGSVVTLGEAADNNLVFDCTSTTAGDNAVCVKSNSTITFAGGEYKAAKGGAVTIYGSDYAGKSVINVNGGTFKRSDGTENTLIFNSGSASITAGDITGNVATNSGSLNISGGSISGNVVMTASSSGESSSVTVSGGNIGGHVVKDEGVSGLTITGGTFGDNTNKDDVVVSDYHMLQNSSTSKWVVSKHEKMETYTPGSGTGKATKTTSCNTPQCFWYKTEEVDAPKITGLEDGKSYDDTDGVQKTFTVSFDGNFTVKADGKTLEPVGGKYTLPYDENIKVVAEAEGGLVKSELTVSNYKGHDWSYVEGSAKDANTHTLTCSHDGCEVKTKAEGHKGGTATCKNKAVCDVCGESYGELDPNNHESTEITVKFDDDGHYNAHVCCGQEIAGTRKDHELYTKVDTQPTETTAGSEHDECKYCDYKSDSRVIKPTGKPVIAGLVEGKSYDLKSAPIFTVTSAAGVKSVTVNGEEIQASSDGKYTIAKTGILVVVATDINGNTSTVNITCYEDHEYGPYVGSGTGTHTRYCTHTGCMGFEQRDCSGGKATCVARAVCKDCGLEYGEKNLENHDYDSWQQTADGCKRVCKDCGHEEVVPHKFGDWQPTADGCKRVCETCGYEQTVDHEFGEWESTAAGHKHTCKTCGYTAEVAHSYGKWTETEDGSKHERTCGDCSYKETAEHDYVWVTDKEATATEDGSAHEECKDCGHESGQTKVLPKTGGDDSGDGDDKGDDSGDKGDKSDDKGGKKDDSGKGNKGSKGDSKQIPATGDPATIISGIAATGAALAATGYIRRRK